MSKYRSFHFPALLILLFALAFSLVTPVDALLTVADGMSATLVLGQPDFTTGTAGTTSTKMRDTAQIAVDPTTGKVFVSDENNNRILRFASTSNLVSGMAAEAVLGQTDFTTATSGTAADKLDAPRGLYIDSAGRLWVADHGNHRVLRFDNAASKANGAAADGVLGQPNFATASFSTTQAGMNRPSDVYVDTGGRLWVADFINNRVLRFDNAAGKANGSNADGVLGQSDFTSSSSSTTQNGMFYPGSIFVKADGTLWVADTFNRRVLRFDNAAGKANGANADGVLGQPDFTSGSTNTSQQGLALPFDVTEDHAGNLFVADTTNNRILVFNNAASLANGANASNVIGQTSFTSNSSGSSAAALNFPAGVFYDPAQQVLWVGDRYNNRVVMFGILDSNYPTVVYSRPANGDALPVGINTATFTFSEPVRNDGSVSAADNLFNYRLIQKGPNDTFDSTTCATGVPNLDDTTITLNSVTYNAALQTATLNFNDGTPLPVGVYRLFVCGTATVRDLAGNALNDGLTDYIVTFTIGTPGTSSSSTTRASALPATGFAPKTVTTLPPQPANLEYANLGDLVLEIPSLNVKSTIVGVPQNADNTWDVTWLGKNTGWLNGTAFPTWNGNSVLTAHVINASGLEGPFAALKSLKYGDQIIVHFGGAKYVYEVRATKLVRPYSTSYAFQSKSDAAYLTLITCQGYNPLNESYLFRRVVRAVLVEVK